MSVTETAVEEALLDILLDLNYEIQYGPEIGPDGSYPERSTYSDVILQNRLQTAIYKFNDKSRDALEEAIKEINKIESPDLYHNNRAFHDMLVNGVEVDYYDDGRVKGANIKLIDFDNPWNNDFLAVNQFTVIEDNQQNYQNKRPDVVLFVNGIPLVVIELKNFADEDATIFDAYNQLETYKTKIPSLFRTNEMLVVSDGQEAKMGSLTANWERFMPWKTIEGETDADTSLLQMEVLARGILDPLNLLEYIRFFITYEEERSEIIKKSAFYHQFHAVNVAINETLRATSSKGDQKIGVVWHTQGSGKSLTMTFYTGKLIQELSNPTILVITDRNDLDDQLFTTFAKSSDLLRQIPEQAKDREHIKELLTTTGGGIIFSTIQKFLPKDGDEYPQLSDRRNIVVIADEAHRSQYSFGKEMDEKGLLKEGFAAHIRRALPNASFIGFTGTPIELVDRNTKQVFGDYISIYDISKSIEDQTTVPIYYESRLAKIRLNEAVEPTLDREFEELAEDVEDEFKKEKMKSKWSSMSKLVGDPDRIAEIADDILNHFDTRSDAIEGKGMIVCMSREICVDMYNEIIKLRPDWHSDDDSKGLIKVIMSGSSSDEQKLQPHIRSKRQRDVIKARVIDPDDPIKLVIVCSMWLTGFDAPCLHTMYVDKPMKGHTLMQAIARVNRVWNDKPGGLIVDYIGIGYYLKKALSSYSDQKSRDQTGIPIKDVLDAMHMYYEIVSDMFHGFDYSIFFEGTALQRIQILPRAMEHILEQLDGKERFLDNLTSLNRAYTLAVPHDEALEIRDDLAFFQAVRAGLVKTTKRKRQEEQKAKDHAIRQLIQKAVVSDDVMDIFQAAGLEKPEISILSTDFLKEVQGMEHKNLAVEMLHKLLDGRIKSITRRNIVQARSFTEMLKETIIKYQNRTIEASAILEELIELANRMKREMDKGKELGLNNDEKAFYDALSSNKSAEEIMGTDILKDIAKELVQKVRKSASIDFTKRKAVQARMRVEIKELLKKYDYPPDKRREAVKLIMDQAQLFGEEWATV